ncbi:MAG: VWA domain-containing protein [Bdellovibrionales bacterium]|nr:VWA domain-containing protein [Bdellovibrionales bacterium]
MIQTRDIADGTGYDKKEAWDVAVHFQDIKRHAAVLSYRKQKELESKAIQGVMNRARKLVGPVRAAEKDRVLALNEIGPGTSVSEIDLESTLEADPVHFSDLRFLCRTPKRVPIAVLMDVSMSMKGDKLAHLALSASAMALSIPGADLCFAGFDSKTTWVKRFDEKVSTEKIVAKILNLPAAGFTNMDAAFSDLKAELESAKRPRANVILIGDGKYTEGRNPLEAVQGFFRLHVLKIGKDIGGRQNLKDLAQKGSGQFIEARQYADLPKCLYSLLRAAMR